MTAVFTLEEILDATHGTIAQGSMGYRPGRLVWNLDEIRQDDWFVALSFENEDTHDSLSTAFELGAQGCIVNNRRRFSCSPSDGTLVSVADTEIALLELASSWRDAATQKVVTVTGTRGRKDTIDLLEQLLQKTFRCHTAIENGGLKCIPDLLSMPKETDLLIAEVSGVNRGDVARVGYYLKPDLAIITPSFHPIPSETRDARIAALNCEILETIDESRNGMAVVYDSNNAVRERSNRLLSGLNSICFSEDTEIFSNSQLSRLKKSNSVPQEEKHLEESAWCALAAAKCLGFSVAENSHFVSQVLVNKG